MRDLKFRLRMGNKIVGYENFHACYWWYRPVDSKTLTQDYIDHNEKDQWTGLLDRNSKEIYEGDIFLDVTVKYIVEYVEETCQFIFNPKKIEGNTFNICSGEVIKSLVLGGNGILGNIYENPELLEK